MLLSNRTAMRRIVRGIAEELPAIRRLRPSAVAATGGTDNARYCYSVWLRHLVMARTSGLSTRPPSLAELGPGDSIGIGLAALISGTETYFALDVARYANVDRNLEIFDALVSLFRDRADIPDNDEHPQVEPRLSNHAFPADILDARRLAEALDPARLQRIRQGITESDRPASPVRYIVPWDDPSVIREHSIDLILSQAVLEHVKDVGHTYRAMRAWLRPGGFLSHVIDFRCHATSDAWNGHWEYSDFVWELVRRHDSCDINRLPCSEHLKLLAAAGFKVVAERRVRDASGIDRKRLTRRFKYLSDDDIVTSTVSLIAVPDQTC
jgi:hypothetical protein